MNDFAKLLVGCGLTLAISIGVNACATLVQINRLDEREGNHYAEVAKLLNTMKSDSKADADAIKGDLQGVRAEIMGILKERRR